MDRMKAFLLNPREDIIEEIVEILCNQSSSDYSRYLIVFPGKRPSHYLRKKIADRIKKSFIPPRIFSMDGFVDFIFEKIEKEFRNIESIDAVSIIFEIFRSSKNHTIASLERFNKFENFYPFGMNLLKNFEELYIEKIPYEKLKMVESLIDIPSKSAETIKLISYLYESFYKKLRIEKLATRSFKYRYISEVFENSILGVFEKVIFAGFYAFTQSEKDLFLKISSMDNVLFMFHYFGDIEKRIRDIGIREEDMEIKCSDTFLEHDNKYPKIFIYSSPDNHAQVYALGTVIKNDDINEETVIVLPNSETLFPLIRQGIGFLSSDEYNISMGYPLLRTPIYGFLQLLFQVIKSAIGELFYVRDYINFMLHPYTKNIMFMGSAEKSRIVIHSIEEYLKTKRKKPYISLSEIEDVICSEIFDKINSEYHEIFLDDLKGHIKEIHDKTIKKFSWISSIGDFSEKIVDLLNYIYTRSTARFHPFFYPFYEWFIKELKKLSTSGIRDISFERIPSYFIFLKKYLSTSRIPFEGTPLKGLQILGFLETRNIKFRKVFFLDLNEGIFPEFGEDYLLPAYVRKSVGLPMREEREALLSYYFNVLIRGTDEVHLFFVEDEKSEKSRFVEQLLWELEKNGVKTDLSKNTLRYEINLVTSKPKEIRKTYEIIEFLRSFTFSPSVLDVYLKCPLSFYYAHVLGLGEREGFEESTERKEIGSIVHKALFKYFECKKGRYLSINDLNADEMERIVRGIFTERYGSEIVGSDYLLMKQIVKRMREIIDLYYKDLVDNEKVKIVALEHTVQHPFYSHLFECRIDRIEERGDFIYIIDYKTGSSDRKYRLRFEKINAGPPWNDAVGSLQIPIYVILYAMQNNIEIDRIKGLYLLLGKTTINKEIEVSVFSSDNYRDEILLVENLVKGLLSEIKDPSIPFYPCSDIRNTCPACNYSTICGTHWIKRKW